MDLPSDPSNPLWLEISLSLSLSPWDWLKNLSNTDVQALILDLVYLGIDLAWRSLDLDAP